MASALHKLKTSDPPQYLTPSPELSTAARLASQHIFSLLKPYASKSPFSHLLTDGFDAEQIWQQIDVQSQPILSSLRRHVRSFEQNPDEIEKQFGVFIGGKGSREVFVEDAGREIDESDDLDEDDEEEDDEDEEESDDEDEEESGEESEDEETENNLNGVEDRFLKMKEMEEYMVDDEAREYGDDDKKKTKSNSKKNSKKPVDDEEDEDESDDEDEDDELGLMGLDDDDDGEGMENARYEDFFGGEKTTQKKRNRHFGGSDDFDMDDDDHNDGNKTGQNKKSRHFGGSDDLDMDDDHNDGNKTGKNKKSRHVGGSDDLDMDDDHNDDNNNQKKQGLSTHEKEVEKLRSEIEDMEKANMEPKTWNMQGEITANKRPKNSALEVGLDFEHNVRPAPVITEEVTASLEEIIMKRVIEGRFDDVQKPPTLLSKGPRETKELDESKSKKGLAELYEDDYAQKTGLVSAALTFSDEQKKEASMLFKKLCVKLDALSHFHFTPKPIIEDMSIQANVPALAMEEVAPLAVSDAAMLAPEEVFAGKGDVKDEKELTKEERKRRRANKKRKFKAKTAKQIAAKAQLNASTKRDTGDEES